MKFACLALFAVTALLPESPCLGADPHLFILSGQSNMAGLKPEISFTPAVEKEFGKDGAIVVKDAMGGQPIRRWFKEWKPASGEAKSATGKSPAHGDLYDRLMEKVRAATKGKKLASVTFVWMQGERDAKEKHGDVYEASFKGILKQLAADLGREDIGFVIGRLSDFGNDGKKYPHWIKVREVQVKLAEDDPQGEWVDTDDLNGPKNGLHYDREGYKELGARFAAKAIGLAKRKP